MKTNNDLPPGWGGDSYLDNPWGNQSNSQTEDTTRQQNPTSTVSSQLKSVKAPVSIPKSDTFFDTLKKGASAAKSAAQQAVSAAQETAADAKEKVSATIQIHAETLAQKKEESPDKTAQSMVQEQPISEPELPAFAQETASVINDPFPQESETMSDSQPQPAGQNLSQPEPESRPPTAADVQKPKPVRNPDAPVPIDMSPSDFPTPTPDRLSPAFIIIPICVVLLAFGGGLLYAKASQEKQQTVESNSTSQPESIADSAAEPSTTSNLTETTQSPEQTETTESTAALTASSSEAQTEPQNLTMSALRAYADTLSDFMRSEEYYATGMAGSMYDLCDINQDGIPELVISHGETYADGYCDLYAFINGKSVYLDMYGQYGYMMIIPSQHMVYHASGHMGYFYYSYYEFDGQKLTLLDSFFDNEAGVLEGEPVQYQHNQKDVSKEEYQAAMAKYESSTWETQAVGRSFLFPSSSDDWEYVGYEKIN